MRTLIAAAAISVALSAVAMAQTGYQSGSMSPPSAASRGPATDESGRILSANDVRTKLQAEGYTNISDLKREGNKYTLHAMKDGSPLRVVVDARSGQINENWAP